jgi:hypothetical protein
MSDRPFDWLEFWIRFGCAFVFFGFLFALLLLRFADSTGLPLGIVIWMTSTVVVCIYAARVGDEAWHRIINALRWW